MGKLRQQRLREIQAIGKSLSQKNGQALKESVVNFYRSSEKAEEAAESVLKVLVDSGYMTVQEYNGLLEEDEGEEESGSKGVAEELIEAGALKTRFEGRRWTEQFNAATRLMSREFWNSLTVDRLDSAIASFVDIVGDLLMEAESSVEIREYDELYCDNEYFPYEEIYNREPVPTSGFKAEVERSANIRLVERFFNDFCGQTRYFLRRHSPLNRPLEEALTGIKTAAELLSDLEYSLNELKKIRFGDPLPVSLLIEVKEELPELTPPISLVELETLDDEDLLDLSEIQASISLTCRGIWDDPSSIEEFVSISVDASSLEKHPNKIPFSGTLFLIDEPSEFAPAIGGELPLYVPMESAIMLAEKVNVMGGLLPINAFTASNREDDRFGILKKHDKPNIVGVIQSAVIRDKEFLLSGVIWPKNRPDFVSLIANNRKNAEGRYQLGMSMEADALDYSVEEFDGIKCFVLKDLILNGASVLDRESATFQKSQWAITAQRKPIASIHQFSVDPLPELAIAASAQSDLSQTNPIEGESPMDLTTVTTSLQNIRESIQAGHADAKADREQANARLSSIESRQVEQEKIVSILAEARQKEQSTIEAQNSEEARKQQQKEQATLIAEIVDTTLEKKLGGGNLQEIVAASVQSAINPDKVPPRKSTPIMAQGAGVTEQDPTQVEFQKKMIEIQSSIKTLRDLPPSDVTKRNLYIKYDEYRELTGEAFPVY